MPAEPAPAESPALAAGAQVGGTFRIGVESSFNFSSGFDPSGEYLVEAMSVLRGLLVRTLLGFTHAPGAEGGVLIPDLAADMPVVSEDGLTWTFTIRPDVAFGPPLSRPVTSKDVAYAFRRIATPSVGAQYADYYLDAIAGMRDVYDGKAETISGIATPDDATIVFTLTKPYGDFGYRLAMPAAAPIPEEVATCFAEAGQYGRYVISSGPYMIEGSDELDVSSCDAMKPIAGFDPDSGLSLVRNPDYVPSSDSPARRSNLPDAFEFTINTNAQDIADKLDAGELEAEWATVPNKLLRRLDEEGRLKVTPTDGIWFLSMNVTQPPFDDIHVRRALNLVMDKAGLQKVWGGSYGGRITGHVLPDALIGDLLVDYDPYGSPDQTGDVARAQEEMRQSRYDTDGDGICDAPECKDVVLVSTDIARFRNMDPVIQQAAEQIGITFDVRQPKDPFPLILTVANNVPITSRLGWEKDYPDASTVLKILLGKNIVPEGNTNTALLGITPELAAEVGATGTTEGIPSIDADFEACEGTPAGDERQQCWADLDRKIMEEMVPWVPYLNGTNIDAVGTAVTYYQFDQASGTMAYAHLAVDAAAQR